MVVPNSLREGAVLADEKVEDWQAKVDLPALIGVGGELVGYGQGTDSEHPCTEKLVQAELVG